MYPAKQALLAILTLCCHSIRTAGSAEDHTKESYNIADLISPHRPIELSRMYPNVLPFGDMLDPVKRSYQFGFPETLRSGISREVPVQIVFYRKKSTKSSYNPKGTYQEFERFLENHRAVIAEGEPVPIRFKDLANSDFNFKTGFLDKLVNDARLVSTDVHTKYLYRDYVREFLVGTWESWREDGIFHPEERVWTEDAMKCTDQKDLLCLWRRFFLVILSSKINIRGTKGLRMPDVQGGELYSSLDTTALCFWFAYCQVLIEKNILDKTTMGHCPDPCQKNPCTDMAYTMNDNCETYNGGLFEKDFKCTCIETAFWSFNKRACVVYDRCKMNSLCSLKGTDKCHFNVMSKEVKCQCKAGFMGHDCSQPRDACYLRLVTSFGSMPSGNRACNVETGSHCNPVLGSDLYSCRCRNGWIPDSSWGISLQSAASRGNHTDPIPNCQHRHDPCMSLPCEAGDCVSSSRTAMCQCPVTHSGTNCRQRRGNWASWGPWSSCDPDCGDRRTRHRSRACLGLECLGQPAETAWCLGSVDCGVPERLGQYPADRWRTSIVLRHTVIALTIGIGLSMGVIFVCQCCLTIVLKTDRGLLNCAVQERAHTDQIMAYRQLCYKTALRLD